jgi:hypothetical protein
LSIGISNGKLWGEVKIGKIKGENAAEVFSFFGKCDKLKAN